MTNPANALVDAARRAQGRRRPHPGARLLRRRRAAHRPRARGVSRAAVRRRGVHEAARRRRHCPAKPAITRSSAAGPGRRATSTASRAATRAKAPRRCCPRRPARSSASGWCRIRTRKKIAASLRKFLEERLPPGIQMELIDHHGAPGVVVPLDSPYMHAAAAAIEAGFGRAPVFIREGGSIPIVNTFTASSAPTCCSWAGARTTTTRTARTKSSRSTTTTAASWPARTCGKNWRSYANDNNKINHRDTRTQTE